MDKKKGFDNEAFYDYFCEIITKLHNNFDELNIYYAFCLLRISQARLENMKNKGLSPEIYEDFCQVKTKIFDKYEAEFENSFEKNIEIVIDYIYEYGDSFKRQLQNINKQSNEKQNANRECIKHIEGTESEVHYQFTKLVRLINEKFASMRDIEVQYKDIVEKFDLTYGIRPSELSKINYYKNTRNNFMTPIKSDEVNKENKDNRTVNEIESDNYKDFYKKIKKYTKSYSNIQTEAKKLLQQPSGNFRKYRSICEKFCDSEVVNLIIRLQYMDFAAYNFEAILCFIFNKDKKDTNTNNYPMIEWVVNRTERFFLDLCDELEAVGGCEILFTILDGFVLDEISSYSTPSSKFFSDCKTKLNVFNLNKFISLYKFYASINLSAKHRNQRILDILDYASDILAKTKLIDIAYNPIFDDPIKFIKDKYSITQKEIADILNITEANFTKKKQNKTLYSDYLWFWKIVTGFTYTYLMGETTIPIYGKAYEDDIRYNLLRARLLPYPEIMLERMMEVRDYKDLIKSANDDRKKYLLPRETTNLIAKKVVKLAGLISKHRKRTDEAYRKFVQETQCTGDPQNDPELKKAIEEAKKEYHSSFSNLRKILDKCIAAANKGIKK